MRSDGVRIHIGIQIFMLVRIRNIRHIIVAKLRCINLEKLQHGSLLLWCQIRAHCQIRLFVCRIQNGCCKRQYAKKHNAREFPESFHLPVLQSDRAFSPAQQVLSSCFFTHGFCHTWFFLSKYDLPATPEAERCSSYTEGVPPVGMTCKHLVFLP